MDSIRIFFKYALCVILIILIAGQAGFFLLKEVVANSGFRLAMGANADQYFAGENVSLLIGDSRMMDGINARKVSERSSNQVFNLGFNGLEIPDIIAVIRTFYKQCDCKVNKLIINAGSLEDYEKGTSEIERFMSAFNSELANEILAENSALRYSSIVFPLLKFNNEVFLRSLFYVIKGEDDQSHGNSYHFKIPETIMKSLTAKTKKSYIDETRLDKLIKLTSENGTELIIILPPHHPVYTENRKGFDSYLSEVRQTVESRNIKFLDHSRVITDGENKFADLIHLNINGQDIYSDYFYKTVIKGVPPVL